MAFKHKIPDGDASVTAATARVSARRDRTTSLHRSNTGRSSSPMSRRNERLPASPPRAPISAPQPQGMLRKPAERGSAVQLTQNGVFDFDIADGNDDVQQNPVDLLRRYLRPTSPEWTLDMEQYGGNGNGRLRNTGPDVDTSNGHDGAQRHGSTLPSEDILQVNTAIENGLSNRNEIDVGTTVKNGKTSYVQHRNLSSNQTHVLSDRSDEDGDHCHINNWTEVEAVSTLDYDSDEGTKPHTEPCGATKSPTSTNAVSLPADGIRGDVASNDVVYPTAAKMMEILVAKTCPQPPQQTHITEPISRPYETSAVGAGENEHTELVSNVRNCRNTHDDFCLGYKPLGTTLHQLERNNVGEPSAKREDDNTVDRNTGIRGQSDSVSVQRKTVTFAPESIIIEAGPSSKVSLPVSVGVNSREEDSVSKNHSESAPDSFALLRPESDKAETALQGPKRRRKSKNDYVAKSQAISSASQSLIPSKYPHSKSVSYPLKKRSLSTPGTLNPSKLDSSGNSNGGITSRSMRSRRVHTINPDERRTSIDSLIEQNVCQIALSEKKTEQYGSVKKIGQTSEVLGVMKGAATPLCPEDLACLHGCRAITDNVMNAFIALINTRNRAYFDQKRQKSSARAGGHLGRRQILRKNSDHFRGVEAIFNMRRPRTHMFDTSFIQQLISKDYVYDAKRHSLRKFGLDIDDMDLILAPINCGNLHWALVAIDLRNRIVIYMNSMLQKDVAGVIPMFKRWLCDEVRSVMGYDVMTRLDIVSWSYSINPLFAPLQTDSESGGLFTLFLAEYLERAEKPDFTQTDIPTMRQRAILFLEQGGLPIQ